MKRRAWTKEEDQKLLELAGNFSVKTVAKRLGRSRLAVIHHYHALRGEARMVDDAGWMTANEVAREYQCSPFRVRNLIKSGVIAAKQPFGSPYWRIDPQEAERHRALLTAPKRTWKADPAVSDPRHPWWATS